MSDRICPYCGHVDQPGSGQILAVFNGRRDGAMLGGCSCPVCGGIWDEYAYRDGHRINRSRGGQLLSEERRVQ